MSRPGLRLTALAGVLVLLGGAGWLLLHRSPSISAACSATTTAGTFTIDPEQAENATTIGAEAQRQGLPDHAVSVGLAAALQESKLRNLPYGDRDSLGLFQQRPSQGWGSPAQLLNPRYAAEAFFRGLRRVHGWQDLPIYLAAQRVQRSADASAYAAWDTESRTLARGLTGESPAGFACRFPSVRSAGSGAGPALTSAISQALGAGALAPTITPAHGWMVASWLLSRAPTYSIARVSFAGWSWTPASGWRRDTHARPAGVSYALRRAG